MNKNNRLNCKTYVILLFFVFLLTVNQYKVLSQNTIIADHTVVDQYNQIPQNWVDEVKKMLLCVPGESHGRGYIYGLELLEALDPRYAVNATWDGAPEEYSDQHLRIVRTYWTGSNWSGSGGEEDFWTNTAAISMMKSNLDYMRDTLTNPVDAFGFGWCWDMVWQNAPTDEKDPVYGCGWAGTTKGGPDGDHQWGIDDEDSVITGNSINLQNYLNAVEEYNTYDPETKSFFTTGPVDAFCASGEGGYQVYLKHETIRQYVQNHGGCLFDYADIICNNSNGDTRFSSWDDHDYPIIVWSSIDEYNNTGNYDGGNGACHISDVACLRLGKAMWWMLARIAGWDGNSTNSIYTEKETHLFQNYPNPFKSTTTIEYSLPENSEVKILLCDITGRKIKNLYLGYQSAGIHNLSINANDLRPGIYFYKMKTGKNEVIRKCIKIN